MLYNSFIIFVHLLSQNVAFHWSLEKTPKCSENTVFSDQCNHYPKRANTRVHIYPLNAAATRLNLEPSD